MKTCSCGIKYDFVPDEAALTKEGLWWNCTCGNTLLVRRERFCSCDDCQEDLIRATLGACDKEIREHHREMQEIEWYRRNA